MAYIALKIKTSRADGAAAVAKARPAGGKEAAASPAETESAVAAQHMRAALDVLLSAVGGGRRAGERAYLDETARLTDRACGWGDD